MTEEQKARRATYQREYYKRNRSAILTKKYWKDAANLDRARDTQRRSAMRRLKERKAEIFEKYGNKCARCGFSDPRAFQIDHVHGGGTKDVLQHASKWAYLKAVLEDKSGKFQLLCANCNQIKRIELGEHRKNYARNLGRFPSA